MASPNPVNPNKPPSVPLDEPKEQRYLDDYHVIANQKAKSLLMDMFNNKQAPHQAGAAIDYLLNVEERTQQTVKDNVRDIVYQSIAQPYFYDLTRYLSLSLSLSMYTLYILYIYYFYIILY